MFVPSEGVFKSNKLTRMQDLLSQRNVCITWLNFVSARNSVCQYKSWKLKYMSPKWSVDLQNCTKSFKKCFKSALFSKSLQASFDPQTLVFDFVDKCNVCSERVSAQKQPVSGMQGLVESTTGKWNNARSVDLRKLYNFESGIRNAAQNFVCITD